MKKLKKLIIVGAGATAEIAFEYFKRDSDYEVVGFAVEERWLERDTLFGLPVVVFERVEEFFPPAKHHAHVAITFAQLNRARARLYRAVKLKGYPIASYVSSKAFIWPNAKIGDHCFILEDNTIQPYTEIGSNVVLWSGNHIGHHSKIGDNVFISSHVVLSGFCSIGENCFLGVNAAIGDGVCIAPDCLIGAGAVVTKDTEENRIYRGNPAAPTSRSSREHFAVVN